MPTSRRASRNGLITIGASRPRSAIERCGEGGVRLFIEISIFAPAIATGIGVAPDRLRNCLIPNLLRGGLSIGSGWGQDSFNQPSRSQSSLPDLMPAFSCPDADGHDVRWRS